MVVVRRCGLAAGVHVRDAAAVRGLAAQQAAARRPGCLPGRAGAQGNRAPRASPPDPPRVPLPAPAPHAQRLAPATPSQLPGRAALPQLLLNGTTPPSPSPHS